MAVGVACASGVISRVGVPWYEEAPIGFDSLFGRNITLTGGPAPVRAYIEGTAARRPRRQDRGREGVRSHGHPRRSTRRLSGDGPARGPQSPRPSLSQPAPASSPATRSTFRPSTPPRCRRGRTAAAAWDTRLLGVVEDTGSDVSGLTRGDVVIAPFVWADNTWVGPTSAGQARGACRASRARSASQSGHPGAPRREPPPHFPPLRVRTENTEQRALDRSNLGANAVVP